MRRTFTAREVPADRRIESAQPLVTWETYARPVSSPTGRRLGKWDFGISVTLFAVALCARAPLIQRGETLLHPDEAIVGIMAQDIAAGERFPVYFYGQRYMGALEAYVVAALTPLFQDPIHALRAAPALFFAVLVVFQYLMLTRWFGRVGGLIGAAALILGPPMFCQWSISARGGYVEILAWGTAILWAYWEWFASAFGVELTLPRFKRFVFGLLIGSGLWINPSVMFFLLPVGIHHVATRLPEPLRFFQRLGRCALPVMVITGVLALNVCWSVWVEEGSVRSRLLLGLVPPATACGVILVVLGALAWVVQRRMNAAEHARQWINRNILAICGVLLGAMPCLVYVVSHLMSRTEMEPALPLGLRPLWLIGEPLVYLFKGVPMFFGADPRPFVDHVTVGRDRTVQDLDIFNSALAQSADRVALASLATLGGMVLWLFRRELGDFLSLRGKRYSLALLLIIGVGTAVSLFLLGGCTCSFTTIRYLLPVWVFVPGLIAAVVSSRELQWAGRIAALLLFVSWAAGQFCLYQQVGTPHPLRGVAQRLKAEGIAEARAEILDAHLLTYLTGQSCRVAEHEPFWPRLAHLSHRDLPTVYLVNTRDWDRTADWTDQNSPGPPPPETQRCLWPALRRALQRDRSLLVSRRPLCDGYELFFLGAAFPAS